jgi:hypothetical protein
MGSYTPSLAVEYQFQKFNLELECGTRPLANKPTEDIQYNDYKGCEQGNWVLVFEPRLKLMALIFFQPNEKGKKPCYLRLL